MSSCEDRLRAVFVVIFQVEAEKVHHMTMDSYPEWDSLRHIELVSEIEDRFGIELSNREVASLQSFTALRNRVCGESSQ